MEIKTQMVELRILTASDGMVLTNGESFSSVGGNVYLGINDSPENWHEITEDEYEEIIKEESEETIEEVIEGE